MELYLNSPIRFRGVYRCSFSLPVLLWRHQRRSSRKMTRVSNTGTSFSRLTVVRYIRQDSGEKQDSLLRATGLSNQVVSRFSYNQLVCIRLLQDEEHKSLKIFVTKTYCSGSWFCDQICDKLLEYFSWVLNMFQRNWLDVNLPIGFTG